MSSLMEWLFGLERIRWGRDAPLHLRWELNPPPWLIALVALGVVTIVVILYRHEQATRGRRVALCTVRCLILAWVAVLLCGPSLVLEQNRIEPSRVALLLDTSLSMARTDSLAEVGGGTATSTEPAHSKAPRPERETEPNGTPDPMRRSRMQLVQEALLRDNAAACRALVQRHVVHGYSFAAALEPRGIFDATDGLNAMREWIIGARADGAATNLTDAIEKTLDHVQGARLAGLVLASDGRATSGDGLSAVVQSAAARQVPIYPLRVGSTQRPCDVEVGSPRAEEAVYLQDEIVVEARIHVRGLAGPTPVTVQLIEDRENRVVDARSINLSGAAEGENVDAAVAAERASAIVELQVKPHRPGRIRFRVEVSPLPNEEVTENNAETVEVQVVETKLRVLYVEGYPRYEYRYLKNALLREPTIEVSALLLDADESFVQEGADPIRRFPETPEELHRFDVVLFGDVDPQSGWLTAMQMNLLLDFVGNEGAGFGLIAGERSAPGRLRGTPLEKLIPVRIDPDAYGPWETALTTGYSPQVTAEGRLNRLFRFPAESAADAATASPHRTLGERGAWIAAMPDLYWIARTLGPKPGATVLVEHPTLRTREDAAGGSVPMPLLVAGHYGAGRIFFQATDETWRWRRFRLGPLPAGEMVHDSYWVQAARLLSPARSASAAPRWIVTADRRRYAYGERVSVEVEVMDAELDRQIGDALKLVVHEIDSDGARTPRSESEGGEGSHVVARVDAYRRSANSNRFDASLVPPRSGEFVVRAEGLPSELGRPSPSARIRVEKPALESRRPDADHEALALLAESTGGRILELDDLEAGFAEIRERTLQIPDDLVEPLWDSRFALAVFLLMISIEWIMRKRFGLL